MKVPSSATKEAGNTAGAKLCKKCAGYIIQQHSWLTVAKGINNPGVFSQQVMQHMCKQCKRLLMREAKELAKQQ